MDQYVGELFSAVVAALITYFSTRKRQKVDTKQIEVDVLEKALQVIQKDVVEPLTKRLALLQKENETTNKYLNKLQNAINKMYNCRSLSNCPIRIELQKPEGNNRKGNVIKSRANRPRDSTHREDNEGVDNSKDNGDNDTESGADR
ncbi:hypothetical protein [Dysgonomonas sp. ZJ279]|uniref:hypothetical protein n=1 Tax=Dysgonomonas sp. ZJ279 TaxID=2709796 RepID=UPI0013EA40A2|nr:hypothetical protein [Dysgonomonas sp. ZJ279]